MAAFGDRPSQQAALASAAQLQQWAASDPTVQRILAQPISPMAKNQQLAAYQRASGHTATGYHIDANSGHVVPDGSAWEGVGVAGLGLGGLAFGGALAGAGGPAAGGGSAATTAGATSAPVTAADVTGPTLGQLGATPAQVAALTAGPTATMSIWDTIGKLAPLASAGATLGAAGIGASANTEAAKIQAAEADKALALQKQIYDTTRGDLGPYRDIGGAAVGQLGYGLGLPGYESGKAPAQPAPSPFTNPVVSGPGASQSQIQPGTRTVTNTPGSTSNATGPGNTINPYVQAGQQAAGGGMVSVKAPNGSVGQIPANRLNDALAAGGQVVS